MILAYTALALSSSASWFMTGLAVVADVAMVASAGMSIYSGNQANSVAKSTAAKQMQASQAAAAAQQAAAAAQADQLKDQAELAELQANVEEKKAGVAQEQGEIEERRRMIQLSSDLGNSYAQWAGNGLLVDGGNDTLGQILTANTREAGQDIGIIKSNTENAVWEHEENKASDLISAESYRKQASNALAVGSYNAEATILSGEAQAYATRQAGLTALYQGWGKGISTLGSWAGGFVGAGAGAGAGATSASSGSFNLGLSYLSQL